MSQHHDFDRSLARWFDAEAHPGATADVLDRALRATRRRRPHPRLFAALGSHWVGDSVGPAPGGATLGRTGVRASLALLLLLLVLALVAGAVLVGARLPQPTPVDLGIFEPISGWIVYENDDGIWGDNPDGPDVKLTVGAGTPLGWSRDGTRLLLRRQGLVVLDADGSETRLTTDWLTDSLFVRAATISPDGSRVVFATIDGPGDTGFLFSVDADGGSAEMLLELDGLEGVSFSPDGTRIAYVSGHGDGGHRVSVMDADGTNGREILANDVTLDAGHDHGIAWSPAGDRIALGIEGIIYTFAPDGSGFTLALRSGRLQPFWSPDGSHLETRGPWHPGKLHVAPSPSVEPTAAPSLESRVTELLNGFLQARVARLGAGNFLNNPSDAVPLLYATSSGASYDRGEFERVPGIEWPYGWTAFKVRLFAGDTVVEQLFFTSLSGPGGLDYQYDGFRTDIAPTTENGQPVGVPSTYFDGEVTMQAVHPWVGSQLIPEGVGPSTDGGERNGWRRLIVKAVPANCQPGRPANAEGVAESIRSDPDLEATPPVAVSAGGANALMMDVVTAAGASACGFSIATGDRMRLYLIDAPEGSSMRVLAIAIVIPESSFARAVAPAASMVESIEFHAP